MPNLKREIAEAVTRSFAPLRQKLEQSPKGKAYVAAFAAALGPELDRIVKNQNKRIVQLVQNRLASAVSDNIVDYQTLSKFPLSPLPSPQTPLPTPLSPGCKPRTTLSLVSSPRTTLNKKKDYTIARTRAENGSLDDTTMISLLQRSGAKLGIRVPLTLTNAFWKDAVKFAQQRIAEGATVEELDMAASRAAGLMKKNPGFVQLHNLSYVWSAKGFAVLTATTTKSTSHGSSGPVAGLTEDEAALAVGLEA